MMSESNLAYGEITMGRCSCISVCILPMAYAVKLYLVSNTDVNLSFAAKDREDSKMSCSMSLVSSSWDMSRRFSISFTANCWRMS